MGIYGHTCDKYKVDNNIILEIYIDHETYLSLLNKPEILKEDIQANVALSDGKTKITVIVRDRKTVTKAGGCKHIESPSIKVIGPKKIVGSRGVDILIPPFTKTGEKPYTGAKTPGEVTQKAELDKNCSIAKNNKPKDYPAEIKLALKFVEENEKYLNLLYKGDKNEENQIKLFRQMLQNCDYITDFSLIDKDETIKEKLEKALKDK